MNGIPELTVAPDVAIAHVRRAIGDILCQEPRLDTLQLSDGRLTAATNSGMAEACLAARSHALDPQMLSEHLARVIRQDPKSRECALVIGGVDVRLCEDSSRGPWEATLRGWWVPVSLVASKNGAAA